MIAHDELDPQDAARLRAAVERLPAEVEPAQDLWPAIRARIEAGRVHALPVRQAPDPGALPEHGAPALGATGPRGVPVPWYAAPRRLAAAAVLLVAATAATTWWVSTRPGTPPASAGAGAPAPAMAADAAGTARALASFASYERSAAELASALERRSAELDPRTREVLERSLRTIDVAIAEAREALAADPGNAAVRAFVVAAYRQKVDFLRRANDVAALQGP